MNLKENKGRVNGRVFREEREGGNYVLYYNLENKNNLKNALVITTSGSFGGPHQLTSDGFKMYSKFFFCSALLRRFRSLSLTL